MITFTASGKGIHTHVVVSRNGKWCGQITRHSARWPWEITTWYGAKIASGKTLDEAKAAAAAAHWPSEQAVYDKLCDEIEAKRLNYFERMHAHGLFMFARALADDSQAALRGIEVLLQMVEERAKNREPPPNKIDGEFYHTNEPRYPKPPNISADEWRAKVTRDDTVDEPLGETT
jgi:hypothetical protein